MSTARIYCKARNVMQSGKKGLDTWVLEYEASEPKTPDPIMGWSGSGDTDTQIKMKFDSLEAAEEFAKSKGLAYHVRRPQQARLHIKAYADNFR